MAGLGYWGGVKSSSSSCLIFLDGKGGPALRARRFFSGALYSRRIDISSD